MELFTFLQMGGELHRVSALALPGRDVHTALATFDASKAMCFKPDDRERLLGIIESAFGDFSSFNAKVRAIFKKRSTTQQLTLAQIGAAVPTVTPTVAAPSEAEEEKRRSFVAPLPAAAPSTTDGDAKKNAHHGARPAFGSQKLVSAGGAPAAETTLLDQLGQISQRIFGAPEGAPQVAGAKAPEGAKAPAEAEPDLNA